MAASSANGPPGLVSLPPRSAGRSSVSRAACSSSPPRSTATASRSTSTPTPSTPAPDRSLPQPEQLPQRLQERRAAALARRLAQRADRPVQELVLQQPEGPLDRPPVGVGDLAVEPAEQLAHHRLPLGVAVLV